MTTIDDIREYHLCGPRAALAPVSPDDYGFLYWLSTSDPASYTWRYHGIVLPYEAFVSQLHSGVLSQFVVRSLSGAGSVGGAVAFAVVGRAVLPASPQDAKPG